nr:immunoglobulin light chain junction region [Macaca mulatta]
CMQVLETPYTF